LSTAIKTAEEALQGKHNDWPPTLEYIVKADGSIALTHVVQIRSENDWHEAFIDAHKNTVVSVTDFSSHATVRSVLISFEYSSLTHLNSITFSDLINSVFLMARAFKSPILRTSQLLPWVGTVMAQRTLKRRSLQFFPTTFPALIYQPTEGTMSLLSLAVQGGR
jgi:hypothetical protein